MRDYGVNRSDAAFAELVRRYVDVVYSTALRIVCDAHLACDITQATFLALAQNARPLAKHPVLAGWLHRTAQNISARTVRTEVRRRQREQEAASMNQLFSGDADFAWKEVSPHLDAALLDLNDSDRNAVLLRYFHRQSAQQMAQTLGVSAEAAQKRVSRAVDRLRECLAKRGVSVSATGFALLLSANAVQAAPAGLAGTISVAAPVVATTVFKAIAMTTLQKTLIAVGLITIAGTAVTVHQVHENTKLRSQLKRFQVATPGVRGFQSGEEFTFTPGDHVDGSAAPQIAARAFSIAAVFDAQQQDGVIIAQGGLAHGYTLYVEGGHLFFAVRRNNVLTTASAGPLSNGRHTVVASFSQRGELSVALDGNATGSARAAGLITLHPTDGLDVGADRGAPVGPYAVSNPFGGSIESVTLRLAR